MRRILSGLTVLIIAAFFCFGCRAGNRDTITQVATIDALLSGVYDGHMSLKELSKYGNFGIGTFEGLDGEMVFLDSRFYKIRSDGKVYRPQLSEKTPFASVTYFAPDRREKILKDMDFEGLQSKIDSMLPGKNRFCAFLVRGKFRSVRTRSVPAQKKPYPLLIEVTKNQPVFDLYDIKGTVIGFRSPDFVKGLNVPGYHAHFLADDLTGGGHVLAFDMEKGILELDTINRSLSVRLPEENKAFDETDFTKDREIELMAVEQEVLENS